MKHVEIQVPIKKKESIPIIQKPQKYRNNNNSKQRGPPVEIDEEGS